MHIVWNQLAYVINVEVKRNHAPITVLAALTRFTFTLSNGLVGRVVTCLRIRFFPCRAGVLAWSHGSKTWRVQLLWLSSQTSLLAQGFWSFAWLMFEELSYGRVNHSRSLYPCVV